MKAIVARAKVFGGVIVSLVVATAMIVFILPRWAPWLVRR